MTPFDWQTSIIQSHSFVLIPRGFSQSTCFPRLGAGNRLLAVKVHRRGDINRLDLAVVQKIVNRCIPLTRSVLPRERFGEFVSGAAYSGEIAVFKVAKRRRDTFFLKCRRSRRVPHASFFMTVPPE